MVVLPNQAVKSTDEKVAGVVVDPEDDSVVEPLAVDVDEELIPEAGVPPP